LVVVPACVSSEPKDPRQAPETISTNNLDDLR
jgi:hypothetical protein